MTSALDVFTFSTRLLVFGNREWTCPRTIVRMLRKFKAPGLLIHGAARGADSIAATVGERMGWTLLPFPADWTEYQRTNGARGREAGMLRNAQMIADGHPTIGLCFGLLRRPDPNRPGKTKATGSADTCALLANAGVQCTIIGRPDGWTDSTILRQQELPTR